jgi:hypothetical protein
MTLQRSLQLFFVDFHKGILGGNFPITCSEQVDGCGLVQGLIRSKLTWNQMLGSDSSWLRGYEFPMKCRTEDVRSRLRFDKEV